MSSPRCLVIGSATTLDASLFLPFFRSLAATGYAGKTCLFVANLSPKSRAQLAAVVDEIVDVEQRFPPIAPEWVVKALRSAKRTNGTRRHFPTLCRTACRVWSAAPGGPFADDLEFRLMGMQSPRYSVYLEYLDRHVEFEQVMIADVRDVLFQRDPFAEPVKGLEVFLEEPHVTFSVDGFNRRWVDDLYGDDGLRLLAGRVVSCSGVTVGDASSMRRYLAAMADEVARHLPPLGPRDQAIHNWLLGRGLVEPARAVPNGHGRVLTMGAQDDIDLGDDDTVLNHDGTVPAVLHQYDRHVALVPLLLARF